MEERDMNVAGIPDLTRLPSDASQLFKVQFFQPPTAYSWFGQRPEREVAENCNSSQDIAAKVQE
ncbi:MAG: hypothetical protein WA869_14175 [Alloacidobacterium sp.]|jgi:hypothetical protein